MRESGKIYALITSVGDYHEVNSINLPSYKADSLLICDALTEGLHMEKEHIRIPGNEGYLSANSLALCFKDFSGLLQEEDTFIFYFSGHGIAGNVVLSDGRISLGSLIEYIDRLPAKTKIIFLDCCHAGNFTNLASRQTEFRDSIDSIAGHGTAVLASSRADQISRSDPTGKCSLFTTFLAASLQSKHLIRKGMLSLNDVKDQTRLLMERWSETHPEQDQSPVFRSNIPGDLRFRVAAYHPYEFQQISYESRDYILCSLKPLSSQLEKRLAAFILLKEKDDHKTMARITREVVRNIRHAEIYQNQEIENRFKGKPAQVIWCYFGKDESDIIRGVHYAYTIWAENLTLKKKYYRNTSNSVIIKDICIVENNSYEILRQIQAGDAQQEICRNME